MDFEKKSHTMDFEKGESHGMVNSGVGAAFQEVSFINKVFGLMTLGLLVTAFVAGYMATHVTPQTVASLWLPVVIAEFVLVLVLSSLAMKMPPMLALISFIGYAVLNGITLSFVFFAYQLGSVGRIFFITAGTFGAMALIGATTKKDLTALGGLCGMVLLGIIIASLVNLFLKSTGLEFAMSILGVLVFVGLIAYDTQKLKQINASGINHTGLAVLGALSLYLDFINLFLYLLRLFGRRK